METFIKWAFRFILLIYVALSSCVYVMGLAWLVATGSKAFSSPSLIVLLSIYLVAVYGLFAFKNYGRIAFLIFLGYNIGMYIFRRVENSIAGGGFIAWNFEWWNLYNDLSHSFFVVCAVILLVVLLFLTPVKDYFKK
ncbi:MAG: hypothetical protein A2Z88_02170 [Omnitrophica WOR_2 bacterium GWA2_47_8]|nr:MAG: hypothetical protein A2Z88_02170 [Omnitrophica WOR_2 bacterium GWA2_47_8]